MAAVLVALVALEHLYFLVAQMFFWTAPGTGRAFGKNDAFAKSSKSLAANNGLYSGFLAAGLVWGLAHPNGWTGTQVELFFLVFILIAAVFEGLTHKRSILYSQGIPAAAAFVFVLIG